MKGSTMKKEASENIVRVKGVPKLTEAQLENLKSLAERPDDEIDYSDIPEITDFSGFEVGKFYRPVKEAVSVVSQPAANGAIYNSKYFIETHPH